MTGSDLLRRALPRSRIADPRASDIVCRVARSRIVGGEWVAGTRLDLESIAREFGISNTPVREALLRLEADGFVTRLPYKGAVVRGVESDFMEEVFALRLQLEGMCARLAARRRTERQLEEMRSIIEVASRHATKYDWDMEAPANDRLHLLVAHAGGANEAARLVAPMLRHTERFIVMLHLPIGMREVEHSHKGIVHAIELQDEIGAQREARAHLLELFGQLARGQTLVPDGLRFLPAVLSKPELSQLRGFWAPNQR